MVLLYSWDSFDLKLSAFALVLKAVSPYDCWFYDKEGTFLYIIPNTPVDNFWSVLADTPLESQIIQTPAQNPQFITGSSSRAQKCEILKSNLDEKRQKSHFFHLSLPKFDICVYKNPS